MGVVVIPGNDTDMTTVLQTMEMEIWTLCRQALGTGAGLGYMHH